MLVLRRLGVVSLTSNTGGDAAGNGVFFLGGGLSSSSSDSRLLQTLKSNGCSVVCAGETLLDTGCTAWSLGDSALLARGVDGNESLGLGYVVAGLGEGRD
jgi:hypothetical protein